MCLNIEETCENPGLHEVLSLGTPELFSLLSNTTHIMYCRDIPDPVETLGCRFIEV